MSSATLAQAIAFAEQATFIPQQLVDPLRPHLTGGHAALFRHGVPAEKALISLGAYNAASDTNYAWPSQPVNSLIDTSYVKVWVDAARLRYFSDAIGAGDTIAPVNGYNNRIRASATRFATNSAATRSAALYDRDVQPGDVVYLTDNSIALTTTVLGLIAEVVAASIASATSDAGNAGGQSASSSIVQATGTVNDVTAAASAAGYSGLKDGTLNEVYTITVIQGATTPGDATSARLSVSSSSGLDNQGSITPSAYGKPTLIGTRNASATFSHTSSDLVLGQVWTLTIAQAFTAVTPTSGNTFTGTQNLNYIIKISRGGVAGAANPLANPTVAATATATGGGQSVANPTVAATATATGGGASGGALPAGTFYIAYTFVNQWGETTVGTSESAQLTVSSGNKPRVTLPALPTGAVSINLYLTNTNGGVGTEKLYATGITATTFDLLLSTYNGGSYAASTTPPGANTTGGLLAAGTYYIAYTFRSTEGETTVGTSESAQLTVSSGNVPQVTLPALPTGAVSINLYLTNTNGSVGTEKLYARNITATTANLYLGTWDGGTFGASTVPPASSTATTLAPQVTAVDITGVDASGPTTVPVGLSVAIGNFGVTLTLSRAQLRKGDTYYINAVAATAGAIQTLALADNLPTAMQSDTDLTLKLYIQKDTAAPQQKLESPPNVNWSASTAQLTVKAAMTAFDPSWTQSGIPAALPVESGTLYAEYRAWLPTYTGKVTTISDILTLGSVLGTNHPDNPLCYAAGKALLNSNGQNVAFTSVADPTVLANWTEVLTILTGLGNVYNLVPLSTDSGVQSAYLAHASAESTSDAGAWRNVWLQVPLVSSFAVINSTTTTDSSPALATLIDNPAQAGTQYTLLNCTTGNAKFVTSGVRAGDTVRFLYTVDGFGNTSWTEFTVASVVSEAQLVVSAGNAVAINTAQRFEIWRTRTRQELASSVATAISASPSSRARWIFPDVMRDGTLAVPGMFLGAALAGLSGAIAPHRSLRNLSVSGFSGLGTVWNNGQLNTIETAGAVTVAQEADGTLFVRKALTSDQSSVDNGQDSAVRSLDAIQILFQTRIQALYGRTNVVSTLDTGAVAIIRTRLNQAIQLCKQAASDALGPLIVSGSVDSVRPSTLNKNQVVVQATVDRPYALDKATITIVAGQPVIG